MKKTKKLLFLNTNPVYVGKELKRFGRHPGTIEAEFKRAKSNNGNPVTPRGHKKRNLNEEEEQLIQGKLDDDPYLTNHQLASLVDGKICDQTVSDIIHRCDPPFTQKVPFERHPETMTEEWQEDVDKFIRSTLSRIPWHRRVYEDETGIYLNEAPKKGRARKGFRIPRPRQPHAKKLTLHVYASETAVLFFLAIVNGKCFRYGSKRSCSRCSGTYRIGESSIVGSIGGWR